MFVRSICRNLILAVIFIGAAGSGTSGQAIKVDEKVLFPKSTSEFSVTFPKAPTIQDVVAKGLVGQSAELILDDCFMRAEVANLTKEQAAEAASMTNQQLSAIALSFAEANGLSNPSVNVGADKNGKFAKLRGFKEIGGAMATYEVKFIYGKRQLITLQRGGLSKGFPQSGIWDFFDSVARKE
ncbi:MAG: hypothetical protein IPM25_16825 [Chloracidobacterium sp.]|nr:hypothetical protein [Chloracidobacterium sp.]